MPPTTCTRRRRWPPPRKGCARLSPGSELRPPEGAEQLVDGPHPGDDLRDDRIASVTARRRRADSPVGRDFVRRVDAIWKRHAAARTLLRPQLLQLPVEEGVEAAGRYLFPCHSLDRRWGCGDSKGRSAVRFLSAPSYMPRRTSRGQIPPEARGSSLAGVTYSRGGASAIFSLIKEGEDSRACSERERHRPESPGRMTARLSSAMKCTTYSR